MKARSDVDRVAKERINIFKQGNLVEHADGFIVFITDVNDLDGSFSGVCVYPENHNYYGFWDDCFNQSGSYGQFFGRVSLEVVP